MLHFLLLAEVGGQGGSKEGRGRGSTVPPVATQNPLCEFKLSRKTGNVTQA